MVKRDDERVIDSELKNSMNSFSPWGGMVIVALVGTGFFLWNRQVNISEDSAPVIIDQPEIFRTETPAVVETLPEAPTPTPPAPLPEAIFISDVPFTVQAPFALWANPLFQDACEEASIIMAQAWVGKTTLTPEWVKTEIQALAKFQKKQFGQAVDTSIKDTEWLLNQYYGVTTTKVETGISIGDIRQALAEGKIVIVPTDGRKLKNPNFKQPGPTHHMVVIIGYDTKTAEFIVNDPGTRKGKDYRYPEAVLLEAITDYATGNHAPVTSMDKVMLTVGRP